MEHRQHQPTQRARAQQIAFEFNGQGYLLLALLLLFTALAGPAYAQSENERQMPSISATSEEAVTAEIVAINTETREVTLKKPDGTLLTHVVPEDSDNLEKIAVGDMLLARYARAATIRLVAADAPQSTDAVAEIVAKSADGMPPGLAAVSSVTRVARVVAIDREANTFSLQDEAGEVRTMVARNPANLDLAEVGDQVVITLEEALAVTVEHPDTHQ